MSDYKPDRWVIVKIANHAEPENDHYRVFATWGGSFIYGQSWKLNSGITKVEEDENYYYFEGYSGSIYQCHKNSYGITGYGQSTLSSIMKDSKELATITILDKDTNWMELEYE